MPKTTPTPFDSTDEALDAVVASMRKLRQRMFATYIRQQPANDVQLAGLRELAAKIDVVALLLEDPNEREATAYRFAEETMAGMLDDSDDMELVDAVSQALDEESAEDTEEQANAKLDLCCRAADYAAYLARGCPLDRKGNPKPL
jgi:predicted lipid-binding transport protein (Tim44 family)